MQFMSFCRTIEKVKSETWKGPKYCNCKNNITSQIAEKWGNL